MAENHWLSAAPVLLVDLRAVCGRDRGNGILSFPWLEDVRASVCLTIPLKNAYG
jgi:hypothetical protein